MANVEIASNAPTDEPSAIRMRLDIPPPQLYKNSPNPYSGELSGASLIIEARAGTEQETVVVGDGHEVHILNTLLSQSMTINSVLSKSQ